MPLVASERTNVRDDEEFRRYCCRDSQATLLASYGLEKELGELGLTKFYHEIVQPLTHVIIGMNLRGLPVDEKALNDALDPDNPQSLTSELKQLQYDLNELVGKDLNVNADEFKDFLFDELGLPPVARTKTGQGRADKAALKKLAVQYPDLSPIFHISLKIRNRQKLKSTFLDKEFIEDNWRLYPNYKIGPDTGRLACKKPNFQNYPAGIARMIFRVRPGKKFVYADYSQVELRILAILSQDTLLCEAFARGEDIHDVNARHLFSIPLDQTVEPRQRFFAKIFVFRLNYGGDPSGEALQEVGSELFADVSADFLTQASVNYLKLHPGIMLYRAHLGNQLRSTKKLFNAFGRPRVFFGPVKDTIRQAYNYPMQSGGADLMNTSLILLDKEIPDSIVLQVHDSAMLEVDEDKAEQAAKTMQGVFERPIKEFGDYSFPAKVLIGDRWGEFK